MDKLLFLVKAGQIIGALFPQVGAGIAIGTAVVKALQDTFAKEGITIQEMEQGVLIPADRTLARIAEWERTHPQV